jgi:hypothetical protein
MKKNLKHGLLAMLALMIQHQHQKQSQKSLKAMQIYRF